MEQEAVLQVRMNPEIMEKVEALYARMGTTFAEAVRIFAAQSLLADGMPLDLRAHPRQSSAYGMLAKYASPELRERESEGFALAMREKYGDAD
jgi:DNA-damage-inducible protein J